MRSHRESGVIVFESCGLLDKKGRATKRNYSLVAVCNELRNLSCFGVLCDEGFDDGNNALLLVTREFTDFFKDLTGFADGAAIESAMLRRSFH